MEEIFLHQLIFGGAAGASDWVAIFAFLVIGVIYLIAPSLGYRPERRSMLALSMYVLLGYLGLSLLQLIVQYAEIVEKSPQPGVRNNSSAFTFIYAFLIFKMLALTVAMLMFVVGLQSLRLKGTETGRPAPRRHEDEDDLDGGATDEDLAARELAHAQQLTDQGRRDEAIDVLTRLLREFPSSRAAITARVTLRRLRSDE